jgi:hypothetical protein
MMAQPAINTGVNSGADDFMGQFLNLNLVRAIMRNGRTASIQAS